MTIVASLLHHVSLVATPRPFGSPPSPPPDPGNSSSTPLWAILLVGLGGALLGGAGAFAGAWRSSRALRQTTEETLQHERSRLLNERFNTAAELIGHTEAACRLSGVHAMAGLADDWTVPERRQTCIDVLCAYLRMPHPPEPDMIRRPREHLTWQANREVRQTITRIIRDHQSNPPPATSWDGHSYDFTGAVFDGADFSSTRFSGPVDFTGAEFASGLADFSNAEFTDSVSFKGAKFTGGRVDFGFATLNSFTVDFSGAEFTGATVNFISATIASNDVDFSEATFADNRVVFHTDFTGRAVLGTYRPGKVSFDKAKFTGATVSFLSSKFTDAPVSFYRAEFTRGMVDFDRAEFTSAASFKNAEFTGATVALRDVTWAEPPIFDADVLANPPSGILLPPSDVTDAWPTE